jgi:hypothetical protein
MQQPGIPAAAHAQRQREHTHPARAFYGTNLQVEGKDLALLPDAADECASLPAERSALCISSRDDLMARRTERLPSLAAQEKLGASIQEADSPGGVTHPSRRAQLFDAGSQPVPIKL